MTLTVHPDPQEPAGGYAFLELPDGSLGDQPVTVAVFDAYSERWLASSEAQGERTEIGGANWQSERVEFGPYEVHRHEGADWVRIGPEIVNKLEEYVSLRLYVGGQRFDLSWPDIVPPRAGAAVLGELQTVSRKPKDKEPAPVVRRKTHEPEAAPEQVDLPPEKPVVAQEERRKGSFLLPMLILLALGFAALLAWYFWPQQSGKTEPDLPGSPCSFAALSALPGGFDAAAQGIRDCGADVSADTALRLIEDAAKRDNPDALLLFGTLYDAQTLDPRIENLVGLTFGDDPAQAVEYYDRAARAGSDEAQTRLKETCAVLKGADATLAKGAYDDFCVE